MNSSLLLLVILITLCILGVILQALLIISSNRRKRRWNERRVIATITKIQAEEGTWRARWYVTATWIDTQTGQTHTLQSRPLAFHPKQHMGDTVLIIFDPSHPQEFRMKSR